jgi:hypothetical protein
MSGKKIQVRVGWWRQKCGDIVRVWPNDDEDAQYPWASAHNSYASDGAVFAGPFFAAQDLVEYLGKNITITTADFDIPELRVPVVFWACPDCPEAVVTWHRGVATCDDCGRTSAD